MKTHFLRRMFSGVGVPCGARLLTFMVAGFLLPAPLVAQSGFDYLTGLTFDALSYHSGVLYWKSDCVTNDPPTRIQRTASGSLQIHTYYQPATCEGLRVRSRNLAADANRRVYWATGDGRIVTLPQDAVPGTAPTVLASMENPAALAVYVAISRDFVYWAESFGELSESGKIFRAPIGGGARAEVASLTQAGGGGATWLAAATVSTSPLVAPTEVVYYRRSFGVLAKSWIRIVAPWTTDTISSSVQGVAEANGRLWFAEANASGASGIRSLPMNNSLTTTLHASIPQNGSPEVRSLTADASAVYWQETRAGSGPIMRRRLPDGIVTEAISFPMPTFKYETGLVSDGGNLMWGAGGGVTQTTIKSLPVNAAAVTWNLQADNLELVQAIQSPGHTVPLVENKPGWLRLRGRIEETNSGQTSILVGAAVRAFLGGAELPGSPLVPFLGEQRAYTREQDRTKTHEGWWFRIPPHWMRNGLELRGEVNADGSLIETSAADNTVTRTFSMQRRRSVAVWLHPLRTHQGTIASFQKPEYRAIRDVAEHLLPAEDLRIMDSGGPVIEEWQGPWPWSFGPYELSTSDDDSFWIFLKLGYRKALYSIPELLFTSSVHHGAFFHTFADQAFRGKALFAANLLISNLDTGGSGINRPDSAVTLAHELAHNLGRRHVDCGDPDEPDADYPYPPCQIDDTNNPASRYQGFSPFTQSVIDPMTTSDLMSYGHRQGLSRWPSDYTWNAVFDQLSPPSPNRPAGTTVAQPIDATPKLLLAGGIGATGTAVLEPALRLPDTQAVLNATELVTTASDLTGYQIRVLGAANGVLQVAPAGVFEASEPGIRPFFAVIDDLADARRIEVVAAGAPSIPLATIVGGGAAPTLTVTSPTAGTVAGDTLAVRWNATDPEGEPLRFAVRYSHDAGTSWRLLADDLRIAELDVPMGRLPGGPPMNALIEILASDGIKTGAARSALFTVTPKPPETDIVIETATERHCPLPNPVLPPGRAIVLHGSAYDAEDGPLTDSALTWNVSGPTSVLGTGRQLSLPQLRPGSYSAKVRAVDSTTSAGETVVPFSIDRLRLTDLATAPVLDGVVDETGRAGDPSPPPSPIPLPYPNGKLAAVRLARFGSFLYVTVAGMVLDPAGTSNITVYSHSSDPEEGGEATPQANSRLFRAFANGALQVEQGNGTGWVRSATPTGLTARMTSNNGRWTAELQIALSQLGGWNGQKFRLEVAADGRHWFGAAPANPNDPRQWARLEMAAATDPSFDGDNDGLPDAWESAALGGLALDGTGDLDDDGQTDGDEYQAGTDPNSATSRFEAAEAVLLSDGVQLEWPSLTGHCYDVEVSQDLVEFSAIATDLSGTGNLMSFKIPVPVDTAAHRLFYRLRVRRAAP